VIGWIPGLSGTYKHEEATQFYLFATVGFVSLLCIGWFFFTSLFYERSSPEYKARVDEFFARLKKPVEGLTTEQVQENHKVVGAIGLLCMVFGSFVLLLMLVPNENFKRLGFLFSGGIVFSVGWLLRRVARRNQEKAN